MLKVENLNLKIDGKKVLDNISFNIKEGEIFSLLGHNGSGKTSILKSIIGIYKSEGKIIFNGEEIQNLEIFERSKKGIGYIMQEVPEYTGISVLQYVKGILKDKYDENSILNDFNLFGIDFLTYKDRNFDSQLSGGEKKKVEIIVSFLLDKDIYLLDEVETSLDATSRSILKDIILEKQKKGISFIIVSHHEELVKLADNGILMCNGKIQNSGNINNIFDKYIGRCNNCEIKDNCK